MTAPPVKPGEASTEQLADDDYDDDRFEEDEVDEERSIQCHDAEEHWRAISVDEVDVGEQLGGGSVGLVHRGTYSGDAVAVKTLFNSRVDDALKQDYLDELLVLSQLQHPNIVHFYGACMVPPRLFYVMELCKRSLFDLLHNCSRRIGTRERLKMTVDVARAMAYLHSRNPPIIHRDLKSLNLLLVGEDGPIKLCDFGLVRTKVTAAGTPAYMAPELLEGRPFNKSVDVYSFGILLWEILSREVPFNGYEAADVREAVVGGGRPKVPRGDCPPEAKELMCQCWNGHSSWRPPFNEIEILVQNMLPSEPVKAQEEDKERAGGDCLDDLLRK